MSRLTEALDELVTANRILAREGVVDAFGHVSIRHPELADRYILSRARAPECIEVDDLMQFALDGHPARSRADASRTRSASSTARSTKRVPTSTPSSTTTARA